MKDMKLEITYLPIGELTPYKNNAKLHPQEQINQIKASIKEFGMNDPIAICGKDNLIVEGHGRLLACQQLGIKEVPVIRLDHLTEDERKAYTLAHNKLTMNTDFDLEMLKMELGDIDLDMSDFGFDDIQLDEVDLDEEVEEDEIPELPAEPKAKTGDLYKLGNHRLLCGDSTKPEDIKKLMGDKRADICFTSPPYNLRAGYKGKDIKHGYITGDGGAYETYEDNLSDEDYASFLSSTLTNALNVSDDVFFNIGYTKGAIKGTAIFLGDNADFFAGAIHWEKSGAFMPMLPGQLGILANRGEPIYMFNNEGRRKAKHPQWKQGQVISNIIETENASDNEDASVHKATFPVALPAHFIQNFTSESVLDIFGGTGTTLIAAEQLGKACYMMEMDPKYVDLIIERWEKLTGQKAEKVEEA